jgi:hypothetical protein
LVRFYPGVQFCDLAKNHPKAMVVDFLAFVSRPECADAHDYVG